MKQSLYAEFLYFSLGRTACKFRFQLNTQRVETRKTKVKVWAVDVTAMFPLKRQERFTLGRFGSCAVSNPVHAAHDDSADLQATP